MKNFFKIVLLIWFILLVVFHLLFISFDSKTLGLILIILWWIISILIVLYIFRDEIKESIKMDKQNKTENSKKYREQYVTSINIENDYFGPLVFEKDSKKNTIELVSGLDDILFENEKIECNNIVISADSEDKLNIILESLEKNIKNASEIMDSYYKEVLKVFGGDIFDENGNMIDESNVANHCRIYYVTATEYEIIFWGSVDNIFESDGSTWDYDSDFIIKISIEDNNIQIIKA